MKPKIIEGTVKKMTFNGRDFSLFLDMPRKPEEVKMSFPLDSDYEPFLNKRIRMTIDEKKITIEKIEEG